MPAPFGGTFDRDQSDDGAGVELIDPTAESGSGVVSATVDTGPSRWLIAAVSVVAVVAGLSLLARAEPGPEEATRPTTVPLGQAPTPATAAERAAALAALAGDTARVVPGLRLVATNYKGDPPLRIVTGYEGVRTDELPFADFFGFGIDSGGGMLAALTRPDLRDDNSVLWVGHVDGDLVPLAVGVRGYAWHDTEAGGLAFIADVPGRDGTTLFTLDLGETGSRPVAVIEVEGLLRMWGDWGFVVGVGLGERASLFDILAADGTPVGARQRGSPGGYVAGVGLVFSPSGARGQPVAVDLTTGEVEPVAALADTNFVWAIRSSGPGGMAAIQATNLETREHAVIVVDGAGAVVSELPAVGAPVSMIWTDGGRTLAYVLEDHENPTVLVLFDAARGESSQVALDFLDPSEHWTRAISFR